MITPKFITFEGIEGSGKTTQSKLLYHYLKSKGIKVVWTREIGGTKVGDKIRDIVLFEKMSPVSELLLATASRYEHLNKVIQPSLRDSTWVICDRFIDSTLCYQGRLVGSSLVWKLHSMIMKNFLPDITFFIDVSVKVAMERVKKRSEASNKFDDMDENEYHQLSREFEQVCDLFSSRIIKIDGEDNSYSIHNKIIKQLEIL